MPLFNGHPLILKRSLALQIQTATRKRERTHHLALAIGAVGSQQLLGQFHLLCGFQCANNPCTFFRISFCTVSSPMSFLSSSGDSPGAKPCACAFCLGSRLSTKMPAAFS